jgi:predicted RecB family nuclease
MPIRFTRWPRPSKLDRLLVIFDAVVLARCQGKAPPDGAIVYSDRFSWTKVRTSSHPGTILPALEDLQVQAMRFDPPTLFLNRHCDTCEFGGYCRALAKEHDHLSLLQGITETEVRRHGKKGIFTVHQLSYTFRPRRPRKRAKKPGNPHHFSLQALAIRENKVFIHGTPRMPRSDTTVLFDIEGLPDRDFYYLIGALVVQGGISMYRHLWADDESCQTNILPVSWRSC